MNLPILKEFNIIFAINEFGEFTFAKPRPLYKIETK